MCGRGQQEDDKSGGAAQGWNIWLQTRRKMEMHLTVYAYSLSVTPGRDCAFCLNPPSILRLIFFSLGSLFFSQKPWIYDLWEVWNGYPRQVCPV